MILANPYRKISSEDAKEVGRLLRWHLENEKQIIMDY